VTEGFDIALRTRGGTARLILSGNLDLAAVSDLKEALARVDADPACGTVLVDLTNATFVDSTIIGVLGAGRQAAAERDREFVAVHAQGVVKRALVVAGLEGILDDRRARDMSESLV
jgi:anti-anti-sigma factor